MRVRIGVIAAHRGPIAAPLRQLIDRLTQRLSESGDALSSFGFTRSPGRAPQPHF